MHLAEFSSGREEKFDERPVGPHDQGLIGLHLAAQLSSMANARALDDEIEVAEFLKKLVAALGMRVRAGPLCGRERGAPGKNGISGAVILYESHAAIH